MSSSLESPLMELLSAAVESLELNKTSVFGFFSSSYLSEFAKISTLDLKSVSAFSVARLTSLPKASYMC